ncbi:hypothetical protein WR25_26486 [Diploscapter pachys]|uniref:PH-15 domain-containing protein n=1 Tax=Diploscapter pachys TaxID=2018661 RepID=A0A2A2KRI9_9BILA|nr:hypothetical protein WR25_26486 [Diploscapter pachys]
MSVLPRIVKEPYQQLKPIEWYSGRDPFSRSYGVEKYKSLGRWREAPIVLTSKGDIIVYKTLNTGRIYPLSKIRSFKTCIHDANGECAVRLHTEDGKLIKLRDKALPGPILEFLMPFLTRRSALLQQQTNSTDHGPSPDSDRYDFPSIISLKSAKDSTDNELGAEERDVELEETDESTLRNEKRSEVQNVDIPYPEKSRDAKSVNDNDDPVESSEKPTQITTSQRVNEILDDLFTRFSEDEHTPIADAVVPGDKVG